LNIAWVQYINSGWFTHARSHPEILFRACVTPPERHSPGNCFFVSARACSIAVGATLNSSPTPRPLMYMSTNKINFHIRIRASYWHVVWALWWLPQTAPRNLAWEWRWIFLLRDYSPPVPQSLESCRSQMPALYPDMAPSLHCRSSKWFGKCTRCSGLL